MDVFGDCSARWSNGGWTGSGIGDFALFKLVNDYLSERIAEFGLDLMGRAMAWASSVALVLVTLWVLLAGYRIVTGQSREPMMALVMQALRIAVITGVATTMSFAGTDLHRYLTYDLDREVHGLFSGDSGRSTADSIDRNLALMQVAMSTIDAVQVVRDEPELQQRKARALLFAGVGAAGPAMTAGAMLLMFKFVIALWIGLGPIFILCLIFDQTRELFRKWLLYGVGTVFSMAVLSVVTGMVLELMARISIALWVSKIGTIWGVDAEGISNQALQQGGLGLILTALIVTVPPIAANFFQGQLGGFMQFSAFGAGTAAVAPQTSPSGTYAHHARAASAETDSRSGDAASMRFQHSTRASGPPADTNPAIKRADAIRRTES
ncbi:MAG: type IV secretion system protein, partial [Lysobacter sp.]